MSYMSNFQISQLGTSSLSRCEPKKSLKRQLVAGWEVRSDPICDPIRPERYGHRVGAKSGDLRKTHRNFGMEKMLAYHFQKWNVSERSHESMNYWFHVGTRTCSLSSLVALSNNVAWAPGLSWAGGFRDMGHNSKQHYRCLAVYIQTNLDPRIYIWIKIVVFNIM